jgi:hypothetical protein
MIINTRFVILAAVVGLVVGVFLIALKDYLPRIFTNVEYVSELLISMPQHTTFISQLYLVIIVSNCTASVNPDNMRITEW